MDPSHFIVYKITNTINGKIYIGITTKDITKRFSWKQNYPKLLKAVMSRRIPIVKVDAKTYEVIKRYSSFKEASEDCKVGNLHRSITKSKKKFRRNGYIWMTEQKYIDNDCFRNS